MEEKDKDKVDEILTMVGATVVVVICCLIGGIVVSGLIYVLISILKGIF